MEGVGVVIKNAFQVSAENLFYVQKNRPII